MSASQMASYSPWALVKRSGQYREQGTIWEATVYLHTSPNGFSSPHMFEFIQVFREIGQRSKRCHIGWSNNSLSVCLRITGESKGNAEYIMSSSQMPSYFLNSALLLTRTLQALVKRRALCRGQGAIWDEIQSNTWRGNVKTQTGQGTKHRFGIKVQVEIHMMISLHTFYVSFFLP